MNTLKLLFVVFLSVFTGNLEAQSGKVDTLSKKILDNAKYRVYYSLDIVADTLSPELKRHTTTILLLGSKYSYFSDYNSLIWRCDK
jgi:hypothetical protein